MPITSKEKIFDKEANRKAWKHLMMYVFQKGKSMEQIAKELRTDEYFLMKFVNHHIDISLLLVERIMALPVQMAHSK